MGCHPSIDELRHFSRWLLHHQPDSTIISTIVNYKLVYNPHEYYSYLRVINHH